MTNTHAQSPLAVGPSAHMGLAKASRFNPVDPMRVLRQYVGPLVITAVLSVFVGVGIWYGLRQYRPRYTSEAQLVITGGISNPYQMIQQGAGWRQTGMALIDAFIMNQTLRIRSEEVLNGALRRDDVRTTDWFKSFSGDTNAALKDLKTNLDAVKIRNSTIIHVAFTSGSRGDPPVILDAVTGVYLDKVAVETGRESDSVRLAFVRERDRAEEYQRQVEDQMKQFTLQHDLPAIESRTHEVTVAYKLLSEQKTQLELQLQSAREAYPTLIASQSSGGSYTPRQLAEADADPSVAGRNERILNLRTQREVLSERLGDKHPVVREIDFLIGVTEQEKMRQIENHIRKMEAVQLQNLKQQISMLEVQLEGMRPAIETNRAQLRDLGLKLDEYKRLQNRAKAAADRRVRAEELLNSMRIQTDRPDSTQVRPVFNATAAELSFPKIKIIVSGVTFLMMGLVTGFAFLKESLDQRIKSPADVSLLPRFGLLGVVPEVTEDLSGPAQVEGVVRVNPTGLMAESFRQIRTSLLTQMEQHGYKTLLLTGAQAQSGTSAVTNNLAMSFAYDGKKVLLLDANYRRPNQHKLLGVSGEPGLIEALSGSSELTETVAHINWPEMDLLPAGHVADALPEMFEGSAFRELLGQLKDRYDVILIDVPPALLTSDSCLMAKHVDAVVVVVRAVQDRRGMISRMLRQLESQGASVLGVVLNGVRSSAGGYFRKNYQAFYRYRQAGKWTPPKPDSKTDVDEELAIEAVGEQ